MRIQYHFQQGYADDFSLSILHFVSVRLTDQSQFSTKLYYRIVLFNRKNEVFQSCFDVLWSSVECLNLQVIAMQ